MTEHALDLGGLKLVARCDDGLAVQARSLLELLAGLRGKGKGLADGVTVQFGWLVLTLRRRGKKLLVCEPDFDGDPFHDLREEVSCTLSVLVGMTAVLNRLGVNGLSARFDDKVVAAKGRLAERRVYLQRSKPRPGDSGWYVGPVDGRVPEKKPASYESLYVYELLRRRPNLLRVLALPPGFLAVFDGDEVEAIVDPNNNDVWNTEP